MKRRIVQTNDGSTSILIPSMDETYHSTHGAIQEAIHVFIKNGLERVHSKSINVFEVGFGTGLNALLALKYGDDTWTRINYSTIEAFPVEMELIDQLNYTTLIKDVDKSTFDKLHELPWGVWNKVTDCFQLHKIHAKLQAYSMPDVKMDIVFFDAFGPRAQAEMWSPELLQKMYEALKEGGSLVTYCAQGQFKRNLKAIGFTVESVPGPPGKREMTVAIK